MGTRSLTYVYDGKRADMGKPMVCMYRQFDGFPGVHGLELAKFLNSGSMVEGYSDSNAKEFNGMGCLAAQLIANFKRGVGSFYLVAPTLNQNSWQEYEYHIWEDKVRISNPDDIIFEGNWSEFQLFCLSPEVVK